MIWEKKMGKFWGTMILLTILVVLAIGGYFAEPAGGVARAEVRAVWVDAFHDGAKTPAQVDKLIKDCLTANINTIFVQVRRRGDAYYNKSNEPRTEDPDLEPGFDALQYLIEKAHGHRIEVHAWLNTLVAWNSAIPPKDGNHVWNRHGPQAKAASNWLCNYRSFDTEKKTWSDRLKYSYFLDPGHPDALDYTVDTYLQVVKNYDVDGIHLDYSRYDGLGFGYNETNVARYNARDGTTGLPQPDDPRWMQWRRDQTANLVRKIYLKTLAIKPEMKVSSAVITWGGGPVAADDWEKTSAYTVAGQDWREWLKEGIIDMVVPMNYFCEWKPNEQLWYNQWIEWEKDNQYGRQIIIGPGVFTNYIEQSLDQIRRAQAPSARGNYAAGVSLFAYGWNNLYSNDGYKSANRTKALPRQPYVYREDSNDWIFTLLARRGDYPEPASQQKIATEPVFPAPAEIPAMPWKSNPTTGYLMGTVAGGDGKPNDGLKVKVESCDADTHVKREALTDGNGWYGLTELPPGKYRIALEGGNSAGCPPVEATVRAGQVAQADF
jgi:uncharacterized lipoprotein YddW (UPF0748 family)